MDKLLVFDLWGKYAHFKKYYTTTSPLTFSIPPKTTLYGLLAAILGLGKDEYLNYFYPGQCEIGIQIINPIKKTRINLNLINTKNAKLMSRIKNRTQIKTEFLKNVKYRIYVKHKDSIVYNKLKEYLTEHKTVYSISLGLSETLANFKYIDEYCFEKVSKNNEWINIITAIRIKGGDTKNLIDFSVPEREYFSDKIAIEMEPNREVVDYGKLVYEKTGKSIRAKPIEYYQLENNDKCILM